MQHNSRRGEIDISVAEPCSQLFSEDVCDDLHDKRRRKEWQQSSPENEEGGLERLQKIVRNAHLEGLFSIIALFALFEGVRGIFPFHG